MRIGDHHGFKWQTTHRQDTKRAVETELKMPEAFFCSSTVLPDSSFLPVQSSNHCFWPGHPYAFCMVMQGGHDGSSRGMPDDALGFNDWSQCGHHAMPAHYRCLSGRYGGAWGKGGDGWMDIGGHHFCGITRLRGKMINCYLGRVLLSLGRYGH